MGFYGLVGMNVPEQTFDRVMVFVCEWLDG